MLKKQIVLLAFVFCSMVPTQLFARTASDGKQQSDSLGYWKQLEIDEVVITGTRSVKRLSESPVLTTVIREADIKRSGSSDVFEVLSDNVPGLLIQDAGAMGTDIFIKGLSAQYILILIDGERLASNGRSGNVNLDQIDVNNVARIEYINGAASSLYGSNAMGGVINIITKNATKGFEGGAEYRYESSSKNKYRAHISSKLDKFSVYAGGSYGKQNYYAPEEGSTIWEYDEYNANLKLQYRPIDRLKIAGTGRFYRIETFNPPSIASSTHSLEDSYTLGAEADYTSKNSRNRLVASTSYNGSYQYDVLEIINRKQPNDLNGYMSNKIIDTYKVNDDLDAMFGVEGNIEYSSSVDKMGSGITNKDNYDLNAFAQIDWDITKQINAIVGTRYTYNAMFGASFDPKLSLMYKNKKMTYRGSVGTAYKAPALRELYYDFEHTGGGSAVFHITGNENLKAEKGFFSSLSAEFTHKNINISSSLYYNNIKDKINMVSVYNPDDPTALPNQIYENVGRAEIKGVDINLRYVLLKELVFVGNYTLNYSTDLETNETMAGTSRHYATLQTTWNSKIASSPFSLQVAGRFSSPRFSYDSSGELVSTDSFSIWKVALLKPIKINKHKFDITAKVDNVFAFTHDYYTTTDRQYVIGVTYKFN